MKNTSQPNYELLKDAYAIIDGIPEDKINLRVIRLSEGKSLECGTICCAAGWLASHPTFKALGLSIANDRCIYLNGEMPDCNNYSDQMAAVFGITKPEASDLFDQRQANEPRSLTDKEIWLRRVRQFLKQKGQL